MPFGFDDAIAGIGLLGGLFGGGKEDPNVAIAREENARRKKLYEMMLNIYNQRKSEGYYDPESRIAQLRNDISTREGRQLENMAGSARIMGYRPGDTAPQRMMEGTSRGYMYQFNQMSNELRDRVRQQEMNDLSGINSGMQPYVNEPTQGPKYGGLLGAASPWLSKWSNMLGGGANSGAVSSAANTAVSGISGLFGGARSPATNIPVSYGGNYGFNSPDPMADWKRKFGGR